MGVDTWDTAPGETSGGGWKQDDHGVAVDGWAPDGDDAFDEGFTGEISEANISKHAQGEDGPADGGCRFCGEDSHFVRDCPSKPATDGLCFNCGEEGHSKAECTNERVEREFTGECHHCGEMGHRKGDCPSKPPSTCKVCGEEGHSLADCTANRLISGFANMNLQQMSIEDAWKEVQRADREKEVSDIKRYILTYAVSYPAVTLTELEEVFRESDMNTFLIAKKQEISATHTIVNLQGAIDQTYAVSIQFGAKPRRAKFAEGWPDSPEENMERLAEAGFIMDRMVQKCSNCGELGHGSRMCKEEKQERAKLVITCGNCGEEGHYLRDCDQKRKYGAKECKNCGELGHISRECPSKEPKICRNCQQEGHRAKDCENERVMKCNNCDEIGHMGKECSKPKDWSRVKCKNCEELGHGDKRCPMPLKEVDAASGDEGRDNGGADGGWGKSAGGDTGGAWGGSAGADCW